ncbi:MAG TPA: transposase, partial [Ramlibacter sp.]|nr:transposase [Ramlibacter sp.]
PHHVIQRGNNRQPIFQSDGDRRLLLDLLEEYSRAAQVAIHSYVLMDNHFHLLATPATDQGLPDMMQAVGRRYVRNFNTRHARTGTLFEGRYRSTVVQTERYLLACMVYIDLNPVRAGLVQAPTEFPWSSHRHYVGLGHDRLVNPHSLYWQLGNTPFAREEAYRQLVDAGLHPELQKDLAAATHRGWAVGDSEYLATLQRAATRRPTPLRPGRPRKPADI